VSYYQAKEAKNCWSMFKSQLQQIVEVVEANKDKVETTDIDYTINLYIQRTGRFDQRYYRSHAQVVIELNE